MSLAADEQAHLERLLMKHRTNVRLLELQAADYGASAVPLFHLNALAHERAAIADYEAQLAAATVRPPAPQVYEPILELLSYTYRRAFSMNFRTRFARLDDFHRVLTSIQSCRIFLQARIVRLSVLCEPRPRHLLHAMLQHLDSMERTFQHMEPYARNRDYMQEGVDTGHHFLAGRLDGTGQPGLRQAFVDVEVARQAFLLTTMQLADLFVIDLPTLPNLESDRQDVCTAPDPWVEITDVHQHLLYERMQGIQPSADVLNALAA